MTEAVPYHYAVSPNQFALPGMEEGAHPTAKLLTKGYSFHLSSAQKYRYDHMEHVHTLSAEHESLPGHEAAGLDWAGSKDEGSYYPGEIKLVQTANRHLHRGLATALYQTAVGTNLGKDTRPVHSPTLTDDGQAWSQKVGGYRFDPQAERSNTSPFGYHPFEEGQADPHEDIYTKRAKAQFHDRRLYKAGHRMFPEMDTE